MTLDTITRMLKEKLDAYFDDLEKLHAAAIHLRGRLLASLAVQGETYELPAKPGTLLPYIQSDWTTRPETRNKLSKNTLQIDTDGMAIANYRIALPQWIDPVAIRVDVAFRMRGGFVEYCTFDGAPLGKWETDPAAFVARLHGELVTYLSRVESEGGHPRTCFSLVSSAGS